jgi:hypothetical protein
MLIFTKKGGLLCTMVSYWPTGVQIRTILLDRCEAFCRHTGTRRSILSFALTRNAGFLSRLANGGNMTLGTYDDCMARLEMLERHPARLVGLRGRAEVATPKGTLNGKKSAPQQHRSKSRTVPAKSRKPRSRQRVEKRLVHAGMRGNQ